MKTYDVLVVGLGAMGSATTYQLAKAGVEVVGIDQYAPPHKLGSTHGDTRISRLATAEGSEYVPFVKRSHELWREIEKAVGYSLLTQCGGLIMSVGGNSDDELNRTDFLSRTCEIAEKHDITHEKLSTSQLEAKFPQFNLSGTEQGYYEPMAGYLFPEKCVQAQLELARKSGAVLRLNEKVTTVKANSNDVVIVTNKAAYRGSKLIVSAGAWVKDFLPEQSKLFKIYRQTLHWFDVSSVNDYERYRDMPIFIWEYGSDRYENFYGFPAVDGPKGGIKLATETYDAETSADDVVRVVTPQENQIMYDRYAKRLNGIGNSVLRATSCMYTNTVDANFLIDFHPKHQNIIIASPCSGRGFKHSAAIGEVLSQLAIEGKSAIDISSFGFDRFHKVLGE